MTGEAPAPVGVAVVAVPASPAPSSGSPPAPVVVTAAKGRWAGALRAANAGIGFLLVGWGTTHGTDLYVILGAAQVVIADLLTEYGSGAG